MSFPDTYPLVTKSPKVIFDGKKNKIYCYYGFENIFVFDINLSKIQFTTLIIKPQPRYKETDAQRLFTLVDQNIHILTSYPHQIATNPNIFSHLTIDTNTGNSNVLHQSTNFENKKFLEYSKVCELR